jgi:hypothetical protein
VSAGPTRIIANYLPQFHPIPENDEWWGAGFTEWTNVARARPLFRGHHQPNLPGELGFYDLRLPETRTQQAALAAEYGVHAFCYWHYWFGHGRRILERPFDEVLASGEPDFPFCLGWANADWTGRWYGAPGKVLIRQQYLDAADDEAHFRLVEPAFHDPRYVRVHGKPLFYIFRADWHPHLATFVERWRGLADRSGLPGIHFVGEFRPDESAGWSGVAHGVDASVGSTFRPFFGGFSRVDRVRRKLYRPDRVPYRRGHLRYPHLHEGGEPSYPIVLSNFDNTPRSGRLGVVLLDATPELFAEQLRLGIELAHQPQVPEPLVFLRSWNEWAEGNYVEPDRHQGRARLEVILRVQSDAVRPGPGR